MVCRISARERLQMVISRLEAENKKLRGALKRAIKMLESDEKEK